MRERERLQLRYLDDSETTSEQGDNYCDPILTAERYLAKGEAKIRQGTLDASVRKCCTLRACTVCVQGEGTPVCASPRHPTCPQEAAYGAESKQGKDRLQTA